MKNFYFCDRTDFVMLLLRELHERYKPSHPQWKGFVDCFDVAIAQIVPTFSWQTLIAKHSKFYENCNDLFESYAKLKFDDGWGWHAVNLAASFGGLKFFLRELEARGKAS